jgi:starch synthase
MYAMRYGTLPVVRRTGGLADSIVNADETTLASGTATGFMFDDPTQAALVAAVDRAIALYRQPLAWRHVQLRAMAEDFGWDRSAGRYLALYRETTGKTVAEPADAVPTSLPEAAEAPAAKRRAKRTVRATA